MYFFKFQGYTQTEFFSGSCGLSREDDMMVQKSQGQPPFGESLGSDFHRGYGQKSG